MNNRVLLLSVDKWEMPDERTGELRRGASVWYVNDYRDDTATGIGFKPTKVSAAPEMFDLLKAASLPAVCDLDFASRPGAQNKAQLTLVSATPVHSVELFAAPAAKTAAKSATP